MEQLNCRILKNDRIGGSFYRMAVRSPYLARNAKPGQFFEVLCSDGLKPFLRRPFGAHRIFKNGIEVLYEVVGAGTAVLSRRKPGQSLDVIGPLGNGFDLQPKAKGPQSSVLVAGGIGVAPLFALAEELIRGPRPAGHRKKIYVLIGAKTKKHILCKKDFKKLGAEVIISTEDGSEGRKGFITDCLKSLLSTIDYRLLTIYACGPGAMLKSVARIARPKKIPCQVSLEERMACGVGVCLGCPVKIRLRSAVRGPQYEYKMVCKDGPVFNAEDIAW